MVLALLGTSPAWDAAAPADPCLAPKSLQSREMHCLTLVCLTVQEADAVALLGVSDLFGADMLKSACDQVCNRAACGSLAGPTGWPAGTPAAAQSTPQTTLVPAQGELTYCYPACCD